jgi:methylmalonyl-CoA mutase, N-terminal domain
MVRAPVQLSLFNEEFSAYQRAAAEARERPVRFMTTSSEPLERLYTPRDFSDDQYMDKLGFPGQWPFTRGVHVTGHRGKLWTMRMFAGFGNAEETNERFKYLLANGNNGLSVAYDMPTLYGYDTDDPKAEGEFGTCGVAVSSLADMEILFEGIPLDQVTTSMTINSPAAMIWAMYLVNAERRGIPWDRLSGTTQNDILKEYIAQKEYIFPPRPSTRLVVDTFDFGARHVPRWNTISISGYHIREAGATALQELAFTLADGIQYVQSAVDAGLDVDSFAPRLSFFFDIHNDFLEEIAKLRAARRIWARVMKERFGAREERSLWCRFHCQTAGVSLFVEQPENNIVRTTIQALAAVLGGTQSLHTNSMDEAMALPSEKAVRIALRTQQIIAFESGVTNTVDPLAGSYAVEALTNRMEQGCLDYFARIDDMGGMLSAIERGFPATRDRGLGVSLPAGDRFERAHPGWCQRLSARQRRANSDSDPHDHPRERRTASQSATPCAPTAGPDRPELGYAAHGERRARRPRQSHAVHRRRGAGVRHAWRNVQLAARRVRRVSRASARLSHCGLP